MVTDPKICAVMPLWMRPEVFNFVVGRLPEWLHRIVFVVSPEDPAYIYNCVFAMHYCKVRHIDIIDHPNQPLGAKLNAGVKAALRFDDWTHLMNIGSDDVLHPDLIDVYKSKLKAIGHDGFPDHCMVGVDSCDWMELKTKRCRRVTYDGAPIIMGAGRLTARSVVEAMGGEMNDPQRKRALDTDSQMRAMHRTKVDPYKFSMEGFVLDIKSEFNLNPFSIADEGNLKIQELTWEYVKEHYRL